MSARRELRAAESAWRAPHEGVREGWPTSRTYARTLQDAFRGAEYGCAVHRVRRGLFARLARFFGVPL